jgi:hypothetical protein
MKYLYRILHETFLIKNTFVTENAIDCGSFIDDLQDIELWQVCEYVYIYLYMYIH